MQQYWCNICDLRKPVPDGRPFRHIIGNYPPHFWLAVTPDELPIVWRICESLGGEAADDPIVFRIDEMMRLIYPDPDHPPRILIHLTPGSRIYPNWSIVTKLARYMECRDHTFAFEFHRQMVHDTQSTKPKAIATDEYSYAMTIYQYCMKRDPPGVFRDEWKYLALLGEQYWAPFLPHPQFRLNMHISEIKALANIAGDSHSQLMFIHYWMDDVTDIDMPCQSITRELDVDPIEHIRGMSIREASHYIEFRFRHNIKMTPDLPRRVNKFCLKQIQIHNMTLYNKFLSAPQLAYYISFIELVGAVRNIEDKYFRRWQQWDSEWLFHLITTTADGYYRVTGNSRRIRRFLTITKGFSTEMHKKITQRLIPCDRLDYEGFLQCYKSLAFFFFDFDMQD